MARGLEPGDSPEAINLSDPGVLGEIAKLYLDAGAELITTNTFGASPLSLERYGLAEKTEEINRAAVAALKRVVTDRAYISGSVGPSGAMVKPYGDTEPETMADAFRRQIGALVDAGADLICVETMIDLTEARLAVEAVRDCSQNIPIIATMTFDATPRGFFTMMGSSVEQVCAAPDRGGRRCRRLELRQRHRQDGRDRPRVRDATQRCRSPSSRTPVSPNKRAVC